MNRFRPNLVVAGAEPYAEDEWRRIEIGGIPMTAFFFLVPMIFLSGFVFPIENMPEVIQPVTYLVPLRYFLVILRGIFLRCGDGRALAKRLGVVRVGCWNPDTRDASFDQASGVGRILASHVGRIL